MLPLIGINGIQAKFQIDASFDTSIISQRIMIPNDIFNGHISCNSVLIKRYTLFHIELIVHIMCCTELYILLPEYATLMSQCSILLSYA